MHTNRQRWKCHAATLQGFFWRKNRMKLKKIFDTLKDKTVIVTGASRGIGREIGRVCAKDGANVVLLARSKYETSHKALDGTLTSVVAEIESVGGNALALQVDLQEQRRETRFSTQKEFPNNILFFLKQLKIKSAFTIVKGVKKSLDNLLNLKIRSVSPTDIKQSSLFRNIFI